MSKDKDSAATPVMRQYMAVKDQYPEAILFYRMGDFYEMFFEDAVLASKALDLTLTSRNKNDPDPIPMCGVPHHAALSYVARLIEQGHKVAICDQMEDPTKVKGLVKREVVRVITPGVILDEENLETKANNFLAAIKLDADDGGASAAVAVIDASTYEFKGTRVRGLGALAGEIFRLEPREIIIARSSGQALGKIGNLVARCCITEVDDDSFDQGKAREALSGLIGVAEADALASKDQLLAEAAGAAAAYVRSTRPKQGIPAVRFVAYEIGDHLVLDEATKAHLELVRTIAGEKKGSLLWLIDATRTGMGGRLLRNRINYPLVDVGRIRRRLDEVEFFFRDSRFRSDVLDALGRIGDVERLAARIGVRAATPRDLGALLGSLKAVDDLADLIVSCPVPDAQAILGGELDRAKDLADALAAALVDNPPVSHREGGIFRFGFNETLDDLNRTAKSAKDFISSLEARERKRTGIASLKVSYNRVFGYYIEVTRANLKNVPADFVRKQTLATGERYVTPELEEWEAKVLSADERIKVLEADLFVALLDDLGAHVQRLLSLAAGIAQLDCAASLAEVARKRDFVRPEVDAGGIIEIVEGRHPLVEALSPDMPFVPNDIKLDPDGERLMIVTGPNMAGKSTAMRQVALIAVLAQMGSFVPAARACIGVSDRLFTRVGASDNIAKGASTFMVEMKETADILRNATSRSLVILDEVGRGTSTYDGLSIAWAVGEYLHDTIRCKTMFATHFHELVELANVKEHAANYHVAAREYGDDVVFLRKLVRGGTSRSFGIQVAKMAGLPETAIQRAREVLRSLEDEAQTRDGLPEKVKVPSSSPQLELFSTVRTTEMERLLAEIDLDRVTPLESLSLLSRLKEMSNRR